MSDTRPTGEDLADQIQRHAYDPNFVAGFLANFVAVVADEQTERPAHVAAREALEALADFDTFTADVPAAKR
ncbi:MAG TPA: hypothetical protein VGH54_09815 [Mycobacterium sp.]|jgi:hypothetical protein|uniref:hypothetical protein n=1 Tax=Mycobacterium sp. TaxID=1785 RepID=UPI002F40E0EE